MSVGGRSVRAYRPSNYAAYNEADEEELREREQNVQVYAERARAGLPLFDGATAVRGLNLAVGNPAVQF